MITVIQVMWGSAEYLQHSREINGEYCRRHGYSYLIKTPPECRDFPERRLYHRAIYTIEELRLSEMVLYLDGDAYFVDLDRKLEEFSERHFQSPETAVLFPENGYDSARRFLEGGVNTGTFLARRHEALEPMFQLWWDSLPLAVKAVSDNLSPKMRHCLLNDQTVFNCFVLSEYRKHIHILTNPEFGGADGNFIKHLMLNSDEEREWKMAKDKMRLLAN